MFPLESMELKCFILARSISLWVCEFPMDFTKKINSLRKRGRIVAFIQKSYSVAAKRLMPQPIVCQFTRCSHTAGACPHALVGGGEKPDDSVDHQTPFLAGMTEDLQGLDWKRMTGSQHVWVWPRSTHPSFPLSGPLPATLPECLQSLVQAHDRGTPFAPWDMEKPLLR